MTHGEGVRRGVGYGIGIKNIGFSEGFDDYSTARVRLSMEGGEPLVEVHSAAAEVGQGIVTVQAQIARTELGVERVAVLDADTRVGSAGSTSASRQTYVTGGAVKAACEAVRERLEALAAERGVTTDPVSVLEEGEAIEETVQWRHRPTHRLDEDGQGDAHVQYAFSAHRAVVDVDTELGLVRVVELATAQEVGKAMNPQALEGQIEGGSAQGLGLALMEEVQVVDGKVLNASFTDYLLPTILDMPPVRIEVLEHADPVAPYGLKGVGEPPNISTPPAIAAALRAATGRALARIPVRPEHLVGLDAEEAFVARYGAIFEKLAVGRARGVRRGPVRGRRRPARRDGGRRARGAARAPARAHPRPSRAGRARGAGRRADRRLGRRAGLRGPAAADRRRGRALARAQRRLPRALRLPARRLRARAHEGVDPRVGRGAPGP